VRSFAAALVVEFQAAKHTGGGAIGRRARLGSSNGARSSGRTFPHTSLEGIARRGSELILCPDSTSAGDRTIHRLLRT